MESKQFGFAIIGAGAIAGIHAKAIAAIPNAKLIGVYSSTKSKAEVFALENDCTSYASLDHLLHTQEIDIVCICTPSGAHLNPALKAIAANKHCLIEKPLEVSIEKCNAIIKAAKLKGVTLAVVFPTRFYIASQRLKNAIDAKRFTKLTLGSAYVKWSRSSEYYNANKWRGTWELDGGGALMNQAIHSVDMLQWCMGPVESVMAFAANIKHTGIEVEDTLVATLKFVNGALGTIECSTATYPGTFKRLEIMGTSGTIIIEDNDVIKWQFESILDEDSKIHNPTANNVSEGGVSNPLSISYIGHQKQIEDMMEAIAKKRKPLVDGIEGRKSVEIILAIYKSAKTGKLVKLLKR